MCSIRKKPLQELQKRLASMGRIQEREQADVRNSNPPPEHIIIYSLTHSYLLMGIFVFIVYSLGNSLGSFVQNVAEVPLTSSFPINSTNLLQVSTHKFILSYLQLEKGLPEVLNNFYVYILLGCQGIHAAEKYLPGHYTASLDGRCPYVWPKEMQNYPKYDPHIHAHIHNR